MENIKQGFKRIISWNIYRSEILTQPKNNNLDYMINPTFRNINTLFLFSIENCDNDPGRDSYDKYYMPLVEISNLNALIDNKPLLDQPIKINKKRMKNCQEMMASGNLLSVSYHQDYYKLIGTDLSGQTNTSIPQLVNLIGTFEEDDGAVMFIMPEKKQKTILNFSLDSLIVTEQYK